MGALALREICQERPRCSVPGAAFGISCRPQSSSEVTRPVVPVSCQESLNSLSAVSRSALTSRLRCCEQCPSNEVASVLPFVPDDVGLHLPRHGQGRGPLQGWRLHSTRKVNLVPMRYPVALGSNPREGTSLDIVDSLDAPEPQGIRHSPSALRLREAQAQQPSSPAAQQRARGFAGPLRARPSE